MRAASSATGSARVPGRPKCCLKVSALRGTFGNSAEGNEPGSAEIRPGKGCTAFTAAELLQ